MSSTPNTSWCSLKRIIENIRQARDREFQAATKARIAEEKVSQLKTKSQESRNSENMDITLGEEDKDREETTTVQKESVNMVADSIMNL